MYFIPFQALLLLPAFISTHDLLVGADIDAFSIERRSASQKLNHGAPNRKMVAARSMASLETRDIGLTSFLKFEHVLPFLDGDTSAVPSSREPFTAHVQLKSTLPTLLLEEHEGLLESIVCHGSTIELGFHDAAVLSVAWTESQQYPELQVITSHAGCNLNGERHPYLVTHVHKREQSLVLSVEPSSFKRCFHTIDIRFGKQSNSPLKRHDQLKKRQDASATPGPATGPSISFPPAPTSSPTATRIAGATITTAYRGTTILPPTFPGADLLVPDLPLGLTVECKECLLEGSIDLTNGVVGASQQRSSGEEEGTVDRMGGNIDEIVTFYQDGYFELTINDFSAHIELESTVVPSVQLVEWTAQFPDIGIPGWVIPQIAEVGPIFRPELTFGVQLATELSFNYGFDLTIPNNSTIHLDISDPIANSTVTGFQDTNFTALPFQSTVENINLTVSAAFTPQLLLTVNVLDDRASLEAGAFLNLPTLSATIAQVSGVDDQCNPTNASTSDDNDDSMLTNVIPQVDFNVGLLVNAQLDAIAATVDVGATTTYTSTGYPLPTACISYDGKAKTYRAAATEGASGESGGNGGLGRPGSAIGVLAILVWATYGM